MKKSFLTLLVLLSLGAAAQNSISLYPVLAVTKTSSETFSGFLDSYSAYNSQYISEKPGDISSGVGFGIGIRAVLYDHLLIPFEWSSLRSSAEVNTGIVFLICF